MFRIIIAFLGLSLFVGCQENGSFGSVQKMKQSEPMKLKEGKQVLVDDGSCPVGQVTQVTGALFGTPHAKKCIARREYSTA